MSSIQASSSMSVARNNWNDKTSNNNSLNYNNNEIEIKDENSADHNNNDRLLSTATLDDSDTRSLSDSVVVYACTQDDSSINDENNSENCLNLMQSTSSKTLRKSSSARKSSGNVAMEGASLLLSYIPGNGKNGKNKYEIKNKSSRLTDDWSSFQSTASLTSESSADDQENENEFKSYTDDNQKPVSQSEKDQEGSKNNKFTSDLSWWAFWSWGNAKKMMLSDNELNKMNKLMIQLRQQEMNKSTSTLKRQFSYDLLIENERGLILFGYPLFNKNLLISNFDPPPFTNIFNEKVNISHSGTSTGSITYNMNLIPIVNGSNWSWSWDKWHILMLNDDIDDQGWLYSGVSFHSRVNWRGRYRIGDNVRKRYWIRAKETKINFEESQVLKDIEKKSTGTTYMTENCENEFFGKLQNSIIDRFKIELIVSEILKGSKGLLREHIINEDANKASEFKFFKKIVTNLTFEQASVEILLTNLRKQRISLHENKKENVYRYIETFISFLIDELSLY